MALVNPNIAMSGSQVKPADPMAMYAQMQQIQGAQSQNQLAQYQLGTAQRAEKSQNMLADAYSQATDRSTGAIDYNKLTGLLAAGGGGAQIPAMQKARAEQEKAQTELSKGESDLLDAKLKQSRQFLDTIDPRSPDAGQRYMAWHEANHQDPVIAKALAARGVTAEQARSGIQQAIQQGPEALAQMIQRSMLGTEKFMEMNRPTLTQQNLGGASQIMSTPGLGGPASVVPGSFAQQQPFSPEVMEQKGLIATKGAPKTAINLGGGKYAEAVGGGMGKADVDKYEFAQTIPSALTKVNETLDILKNSDINTGLGAELLTTLDRAKAKFTADKASNIRVSNTEYLSSLLGSEVFPLIQSLGIGARGIDTPAEKEYLLDVMTGRVSLNKDTLIRMTENRKKSMLGAAEQYNRNVESGELDKFFEASGRLKGKIQIPKDTPKPKEAAAQIPGGRGAPVFAVNPSTGQRIQSTDGGNTWTPVGGQ
jgi:hypothetical protein